MGGMAEIFKAKLVGASGFSKDVVIKRIYPDFNDNEEFVRMFINEAKIASMLSHPNIAQVLDFDLVDGTYYLAMEYIEGVDLRKVMMHANQRKFRVPVSLVLQIMVQALKGLAYAHECAPEGVPLGIVHRDVSPHNILLSRKGEVKLIDFGIARMAEQVSHTANGVLKGKASYMAPEQTYTSKVDARADLFAMGVVMWEMLTNRRLFKAGNAALAMHLVRESQIPLPHEYNDAVDPELSRVVMWALCREPAERVPSARTFYQYLQPFMQPIHFEEELERYLHELEESKKKKKPRTEFLEAWTPPPPSVEPADGGSQGAHASVASQSSEEDVPATVEVRPADYLAAHLLMKPKADTPAQEAPSIEATEKFRPADYMKEITAMMEAQKAAARGEEEVKRTEESPAFVPGPPQGAQEKGATPRTHTMNSFQAQGQGEPPVDATVTVRPADLLKQFGLDISKKKS